ncbi:MAG: DUF3995 domain-containing protein [Acidimicrobiia bacterium]
MPARLTAATLLGIAGIHAAWGRGSSFPFATTSELTDAVVGNDVVPSPGACYAVAGLLTVAAGATAGLPARTSRLRRLTVLGVAATLATRAAAGFAGRTDALVPGSNSPRFRRNDRRVFAPLCAALAVGALMSLRG